MKGRGARLGLVVVLGVACEAGEPADDTGAGSTTGSMGTTSAVDEGSTGEGTTLPVPDGTTDDGPPPMPSQTEACAYWVDCAATLMLEDAMTIEQTYGPEGTCWDAGAPEAAACDVECRDALETTVAELEAMGQGVPEACDLPRMISWTEIEPVIADNCVTGCHEPGGTDSSLDLSEQAYYALYQVASDQSTLYLVDPGSREESYLWHKLRGSQGSVGGGGSRMPRGADPLPDAFIDDVGDWIDQGAPNF